MFADSIRNLLGFHETILYKKYIFSMKPVDFLSFDNTFLETDIGRGMIFKGERSEINHNFTKDVDLGYKYIEKFRGGVQWCMTNTRDVISSIFFKLKNEKVNLVSFNGRSITFPLSKRKI